MLSDKSSWSGVASRITLGKSYIALALLVQVHSTKPCALHSAELAVSWVGVGVESFHLHFSNTFPLCSPKKAAFSLEEA